MKKVIAVLLSCVMTFLLASAPVFAESRVQNATREYTISEFTQSVGRLAMEKPAANLEAFADAGQISEEYQNDVALCVANGLVNGYDDHTLRPKDEIVRVEALVLLNRALKADLTDAAPDIAYTDVPDWAKNDISRLTKAGIVRGIGDNLLGAEDKLTVEQVKRLTDRVDAALIPATPQQNFYRNRNAKILRNAVIEEGNTFWRVLEHEGKKIAEGLKIEVEQAAEKNGTFEKGTAEQKITDVYNNYMNWEQRNQQGLAPVQPYLEKIDNAKTLPELLTDVQASLYTDIGLMPLFGLVASADRLDSSKMTVYLNISCPGIDSVYYKNGDEEKIEKFQTYLKTLFNIAGEENATERVEDLMALSRRVLEKDLETKDYYDTEKIYNIYTFSELDELMSNADMAAFAEKIGLSERDICVMTVEQAKELNAILTEENFDALKDMLKANLYMFAGAYLNQEFREAAIAYYEDLNGVKVPIDDKDDAYDIVEGLLPWDIGKLYVKDNFSEKAKDDVKQMVEEIIAAYKKRMQGYTWMSEQTKENAIKKLDNMAIKIGYPDEYPAYLKDITINSFADGGSLFENACAVNAAALKDNLESADRPVNRGEWTMTPQTVNAYYNPQYNEIVFPAGIINAFNYSVDGSEAKNLGSIGAVIGHEISHAFDDMGSQYDENGNYKNWWTDEDHAKYKKLSDRVVNYYETYEALPGKHINGNLTVGENIADLGGVAVVLDLVNEKGLDKDEFFTSYANIWAANMMEVETERRLLLDTHSPAEARVNYVLRNFQDFLDTYNIKEGDPMYLAPEDRVTIW